MAKREKVNYNLSRAFRMAGTEKTYEYVVKVVTPKGRMGFRDLGDDYFRIRVEPRNDDCALAMAKRFPEDDWKQYGEDDQPRFSTVVEGQKALKKALAVGAKDLLS